jgi:hypothetical protein
MRETMPMSQRLDDALLPTLSCAGCAAMDRRTFLAQTAQFDSATGMLTIT